MVLTDNPHICWAYVKHKFVDGELIAVTVVQTDLILDAEGAEYDKEAFESVLASVKDYVNSSPVKPQVEIEPRRDNAPRS